jgi:gas vesicle protein
MKNVIYALLAGVAVGILIAPDKGSATRKKLFGKLEDLSDDLQDRSGDLFEKSKSTAREGVKKAKDWADQL